MLSIKIVVGRDNDAKSIPLEPPAFPATVIPVCCHVAHVGILNAKILDVTGFIILVVVDEGSFVSHRLSTMIKNVQPRNIPNRIPQING